MQDAQELIEFLIIMAAALACHYIDVKQAAEGKAPKPDESLRDGWLPW